MPLLFQNATPFQATFERDLFESGALTEPPNIQNLVVLSRLTSLLQGHITKAQALEGLPLLKQQGLSIIFHVYEEFLVDQPPPYQENSEDFPPLMFTHSEPTYVDFLNDDSELPLPFILPQEIHPYVTPPTSPTNQEMHALNGNLSHQHNNSYGDFIRGAARGLRPGAHSSDRFAAGALSGSLGVGGGLAYTAFQDMRHGVKDAYNWMVHGVSSEKELAEKMRKQNLPSPSNTDMHSYNGNIKVVADQKVPPHPPKIKGPTPKWEWNHENPSQHILEGINSGANPAQIMMRSGPTNQEMHAYNGNPPKMGPRTRAQTERTERKKKRNHKKRSETKAYLKVIRAGAGRYPQNRPKKKLPPAVKAAGKLEKRELIIARKYSKFLRAPVFQPPRLGSTGNTPTMLVHGYFRKAYTMSAPFAAVVNATCVSVCINPILFKQSISNTDYVCPIVVSITSAGGIVPTIGNATGNVSCEPFANEASLKNQVLGHNVPDLANPLGRWVGGSVSLTCRCPMATTAPPFMFGGLLPEYPTIGDGVIKNDSQLSSFAIDNVRNLASSVEVPGFTVSSVYIPNNPDSLLFNSNVARYSTASRKQSVTSIPYIGMSGCPTTAVVEVTVSCWFEVQQNVYYSGGSTISTGDYAGWGIGPKVSSEDIYDNLKRFPPVSTRMIGMGAKASVSTSDFAALVAARDASSNPPPPTLEDQISFLKKQYELLRLKIEDEEDEKYVDDDYTSLHELPETPQYDGLSKSTLDLAMSIKKTLTPGSVTHKTIQTKQL